ncbi:MAG: hypothetical protein K0U78_02455 [Actinomycetia bacterium]|nr:hypothetical protein [Actinomycetes bacterium]
MSIRSFSGCHEWDPSCLVDTDADEQAAEGSVTPSSRVAAPGASAR